MPRRAATLTRWIHSTSVIEGVVGEDTQVGAHAYIGPDVEIGRGCVIGPGAVIGSQGFGFERNGQGWVRKPENFGVRIGEDVWIGAQTCIDNGSWRHTRILDGCRIDNLVHVAHNVILRKDVIVVAQAMLAGSVEVCDGAWIGPGAQVLQRKLVGARALVGMGAVVVKDVPAATTVAGNPARVINPDMGVREKM